MKQLFCADLFCGAGGTSTGLLRAAVELGRRVDLLAINHWNLAIDTHTANHPLVRHLCESLDHIDPVRVVPGGRLDLLCASPECTHHSRARGGKPCSDQSRASAWKIVDWCAKLHVENLLIENVREFKDWGPLTKKGRPMKRKKGKTFEAFLNALRSQFAHVEWRVLNCADFGDPTTRVRLFIMARRSRPIVWPAPSHTSSPSPLAEQGERAGVRGLARWKAAREVIDWALKGQSIFTRKKPLSSNTLRRIEAGLRKFGGEVEPFIVHLRGTSPSQVNGSALSVEQPVPTLTASGAPVALCEPFILPLEGFHRGNAPRSVEKPLPTITSRGGGALCEPFLVPFHGERDGQEPRTHSVEEPVPVVACTETLGLCEPFLVKFHGSHKGRSDGDNRVYPLSDPVPTLDTSNRVGICEPLILGQQSCAAARPVSEPLPTVAAAGAIALVEPFLVKYYGTGQARPVSAPLDTVTSRDRFGLAMPEVQVDGQTYVLDIRFRMLQPHELAQAMSFPADYAFAGNREARVKQIGNAVPVETAKALCKELMR